MKCLFHLTSAKNASGVDDLFYFAGVKFLDPNFGRNGTQEESLMNIKIKNNFRLNDENTKMKKKKRKCC